MSTTRYTGNRPGLGTKADAGFRLISPTGQLTFKTGPAGTMNGAKSRDPGNTGSTYVLRAGVLLAKNAATGRYAPWSVGVTTAELTGAGTTLTLSVADAAELVRRGGPSGTLVLTGQNRAGQPVVQRTVTYSAVNTTNGQVTVTALGNVNQIERIRFNTPSTGGNLQLTVQLTNGTTATTANIAWNATDATYLASIQSALDTTTGVANGIVASASAGIDTDNEITLTYSGTGYAGRSWTPAVVAVFPTGSTAATYLPFQAAAGTFLAGSVVSEAGWTTPLTVVPDGPGINLTPDGLDTDFRVPVGGQLIGSQCLPWPSDAVFRQWIRASMDGVGGNVFAFEELV